MGIMNKQDRETVLNLIMDNQKSHITFTIRLDPSTNKIINYGIAQNLIIQQKNGLFKLSSLGANFSEKLLKSQLILEDEISFLQKISGNLTESKIDELRNNWEKFDVKG